MAKEINEWTEEEIYNHFAEIAYENEQAEIGYQLMIEEQEAQKKADEQLRLSNPEAYAFMMAGRQRLQEAIPF